MKHINDEAIIKKDKLSERLIFDNDFLQREIQFVLSKIDENMEQFSDKFPKECSENNIYQPMENTSWTTGFWTGMLWLAYEWTKDEKYRRLAEFQIQTYIKRLDDNHDINHHDLGFLYSLSCVSAYKLTGNEEAKKTALRAADFLMLRYLKQAGIIQAWGNLDNPNERGRMIIDCLINLPLLYWATQETNDVKYYNAAYSHAKQAAKYIVREDASTYHTFFMDPETGKPIAGKTFQGYSDTSCWARGQAWGIYGFALSRAYTGDSEFIELSRKLANYFLNRLPEDNVCYWDLIFSEGQEEKDSSASAIALCGLLEMIKYIPIENDNKQIYENASLSILKSLAQNYTSKEQPNSNGLLLHGVYNKPGNVGIDECCIWGDYFYFEALVRAAKNWKLYW